MNRIVVGGGITFVDDKIIEGNIEKFESLTGTQLQYDTFEFTVESEIFKTALFTSDNELLLTSDNKVLLVDGDTSWQYGTPVKAYHNDILLGKFHIEDIQRVAKKRYKITAISAIGLLAHSKHYGGIYSGISFENLVAEIIGGQIAYTVDPALALQPLYGWLPIATRRENLHQALFAMSASVKKNANGDVYITALSKDTTKGIPDSRIFVGGSVEYPQVSKTITLAEHAYVSRNTDEEVVLFDKEIASDWMKTPMGAVVRGGLILFDEPVHDLTITGSTIIESGVNYAVLSPTAECELKGKKYTHTVKQISRPEIPEEGSAEDENIVSVEEATLISLANSENVADRLASYYGSAKTVKMDIIQGDENTGDAVTFSDPFNEDTEGLITSLDMKMSGIIRSTIEVVADYDPPDIGNFYDHVEIITGNQTWNIPSGCEKVRVVLIGGGSSGFKGEDGTDAQEIHQQGSHWSSLPLDAEGGKGGVGGVGGDGGKILIFSLPTDGLTDIQFSCGAGNTQGNGQAGDATTATIGEDVYTSEDGTVSSIGFIEIFSGNSYGYGGIDHSALKAGDGGMHDKDPAETDYTDSDGTWHGGSKGSNYSTTSSAGYEHFYEGGYGGGAAHGSDGENGHNAGGGGGHNEGDGGNGANGANGLNATNYGCGGDGGYGGGGGGQGGRHYREDDSDIRSCGVMGLGGSGGNGGNGANGCAIIYY